MLCGRKTTVALSDYYFGTTFSASKFAGASAKP